MTHGILISVHLSICGIIEPAPFIHSVAGLSRQTVIAQNTCSEGEKKKITQEKKIEREANKRKT